MFRHPLRSCLLLACSVLLASPAFAQEDDEIRRHGIFLDSVDVSLINVEVHVFRDGEPVTDLTADDFEVLDDGNPVDVTNFFRVEEGKRRTVEAAPQDEAAPAEPAPADVVRERSAVVVVVDHPFISPMSRKLVFERLREQLDALMTAGTQVMVVSKDRRIHVAQPLTSDRGEVEAALERLQQVSAPNYVADVMFALRQISETNTPELSQTTPDSPFARASGATGSAINGKTLDAARAFSVAKAHSEQAYVEAKASLALLEGFVGSLVGLPGRKAVVYVADRIPVRAGEMVWKLWYERFGPEIGSRLGASTADGMLADYDLSEDVADLVAAANANRVAFYPLGAGTDASVNLMGADSRTVKAPGAGLMAARESNEGLRWMASGTGGKAAIGRGDVRPFFEELHHDLTNYYSLAYPSPHRGDGEKHQVEIRLRRADADAYELRYLSEYHDKSPGQQMQEATVASLTFGNGENPLDVRIEIGKQKKNREGGFRVPMEVRIPVANLVLVPDRKAHMGKVTIHLVVRDEDGGTSEPVRIDMPIEIPHAGLAQALSDAAVYKTNLVMKGGPATIAVGVQDEIGSVSSTVNRHVDVGG